MKATCRAHANIALVKYWGKRNDKLILPHNSSVSMTLDKYFTETTVEFDKSFKQDEFVLNNQKIESGEVFREVKNHLDLVRKIGKKKEFARVQSENNFPTAAGLASSSSGFAALSLAATKALGLDLSKKELSILSRQGSGSASRSVFGGFVEWSKGKKSDGSDSFAKQFADENFWKEFRMIACIVKAGEKKWKSRSGMVQTIKTCPYYTTWAKSADKDALDMKKFVLKKDFTRVGALAEFNALKMHATMISTWPPIIYWHPLTVKIMQEVLFWREEENLESYFTMDAGPQVKIMCLEKNEKEIVKRLNEIEGIEKIEVCRAGPDAKVINEHLF